MMKSFQEVIGQPLLWVRPDSKEQDYELRTGDQLVATLKWQKPGGSLAIAETSANQ